TPAVTGCTITSGTELSCNFGKIGGGSWREGVVMRKEAADITACGHLVNRGTATATGLQPVSEQGDQTCQPPHVTIIKTPDGGTFKIGDKPSFTIVVKSDGTGAADNVTLTDSLPTFGSLQTWALTPAVTGCAITSGTQLKCNFGTLQVGDMRTVVVTSNEAADIPACGHLVNTGTATATGLQPVSDQGDQTCQPPHVTIIKTPDGGTFKIGDKPSFTIVVKSDGTGAADNVTLTDSLPTFGSLQTWALTPAVTGCAITSGTQ